MKKIIGLIVAISVFAVSTAVMADSIVGSPHDLSATGYAGYKSTTTQVCVFCHTPHNAIINKALWNKNLVDKNGVPTASTFAVYTSGIKFRFSSNPTWFSDTAAATIDNQSPSYLCMSCHDGVTNMYALNNPPLGVQVGKNGTPAQTNMEVTNNPGYNAKLNDLTNDHPIGFNYITVQGVHSTDDLVAATDPNLVTANVAGLPLSKGKNMECSTCHNVHDPALRPFLRKPIAGSALCVACHAK